VWGNTLRSYFAGNEVRFFWRFLNRAVKDQFTPPRERERSQKKFCQRCTGYAQKLQLRSPIFLIKRGHLCDCETCNLVWCQWLLKSPRSTKLFFLVVNLYDTQCMLGKSRLELLDTPRIEANRARWRSICPTRSREGHIMIAFFEDPLQPTHSFWRNLDMNPFIPGKLRLRAARCATNQGQRSSGGKYRPDSVTFED